MRSSFALQRLRKKKSLRIPRARGKTLISGLDLVPDLVSIRAVVMSFRFPPHLYPFIFRRSRVERASDLLAENQHKN